jgi:hypothetical protein
MNLSHEERQRLIALYGRSYADLLEALKGFPVEMWKFKPSPKDWSIHEQIIHLADSESNSNARFRRAAAEPGSSVFGYDQDRWADTLDYHHKSTDTALNLLRYVRESNYELLQSLPDSVFANTIEHSERGTLTLDDVLITYADHLPGHIRQMQDVYDAWCALPKQSS